jgi:hypothetical protein
MTHFTLPVTLPIKGALALIGSMLVLQNGCQSTSPTPLFSVTLEAEIGFTNIGEYAFVTENEDFYSGGQAILISSAPIGGRGTAHYNLSPKIRPGAYNVTIHYFDENDGHSPVDIILGAQTARFVMDAPTPSSFADPRNAREFTMKAITVAAGDTLTLTGEVSQFESEHIEFVRIDSIVFMPTS